MQKLSITTNIWLELLCQSFSKFLDDDLLLEILESLLLQRLLPLFPAMTFKETFLVLPARTAASILGLSHTSNMYYIRVSAVIHLRVFTKLKRKKG